MTTPGAPSAIRPFKIEFPEQKINDMKAGIRSAVIPDNLDDDDPGAGLRMADYKTLLEFWQNKYNWADEQDALNQFSQFQTEIQNVNMHFIHERSRHDNATPIIILHGWPSGPFEFRKVIPQLTKAKNPDDAFHVVAPSMPGFLFSEPGKDIDYTKAADIYLQLMERLGYERYIVFGSDLGSATACMMVSKDSGQHCIGLHLQGSFAIPRISIWSPFRSLKNLFSMLWPLSAYEKVKKRHKSMIFKNETAFMIAHCTKPRTMGLALAQSPVAAGIWIAEKYIGWTDSTGVVIGDDMGEEERMELYPKKLDMRQARLEHCKVGMDEILTTITLFWLTNSLPTSIWFYRNSLWLNTWALYTNTEIPKVPVAISDFVCDLTWSRPAWVHQQFHNVLQQKFHPNGGHFAALEQPDALAGDINEFNRRLRDL